MAAPCGAGTLRGEVLLDKDMITVGDIFGASIANADKVVGPAPAPGRKVVYDVMALSALARTFGVAWQPQSNYDQVTLTRASQVITAAMVKERLEAELASKASEKQLDIALDNPNLEINRPASEKLDWRLVDLSYDPVRRRFSASLIVGADAHSEVIALGGRAMPMVQVAVLNRAFPAGGTLSEGDVEWLPTPIDKAGADAITDATQLQGMETRRGLAGKSILRLRDVTKARLVVKGSLVTMKVETPAMQITAQGRALSDAVMGETVRVMNTQSNRTVDAVVTGAGQVSVTPAGDNHVALNEKK
ncbi:MAG: flagellar basal body P-ring formation protein FlgA [Proteobacteria bacterium]|nr:flagellar basal body P-ring formation protein FlgA [Pseudomonadota bacterium]